MLLLEAVLNKRSYAGESCFCGSASGGEFVLLVVVMDRRCLREGWRQTLYCTVGRVGCGD